jgi:hypothetical protein
MIFTTFALPSSRLFLFGMVIWYHSLGFGLFCVFWIATVGLDVEFSGGMGLFH